VQADPILQSDPGNPHSRLRLNAFHSRTFQEASRCARLPFISPPPPPPKPNPPSLFSFSVANVFSLRICRIHHRHCHYSRKRNSRGVHRDLHLAVGLAVLQANVRLPPLANSSRRNPTTGPLANDSSCTVDRSLIYPRYLPEGARTDVPDPDDAHFKDWQRVKLFTKDGETLNSYFIKASKPTSVTVRWDEMSRWRLR
jgi:hypothetical protein